MTIEKNMEMLRMCAKCKSIDVSFGEDQWMNKETNPELYQEFMGKYEKNMKISHGLCQDCATKYYPDLLN